MMSWVVSSTVFCILISSYSCSDSFEGHHEALEIPHTGELEGLEGLEESPHHGGHKFDLEHKHATSYQSFYLESKNPVPVLIKKEYHHAPVEHHHLPEHQISYETHEPLDLHQHISGLDLHNFEGHGHGH